MVEIKCLVCDKSLKIPQNINPDNYDGQAFCDKCSLLINVKLVKGKIHKYKVKDKVEVEGGSVELIFTPAKKEEKDKNKESRS